ncbi:enoyl-CoA hydratase/isomerase family protein [Gordonia sp. TBRC 11910]|uniref:Enoyl-CoA hydratase/isomerase family protein n=1 Tax=Gordonia asplenii TaxID=2725283 RepID=A0A848KS73_9ACTN|nr:enoyl-CoA hydratase/isomerase family protein [Gordonia asplenii]NMO01112.1 enoyl-CoA hydratase/isomerase family protein [Gordonia asplenii]
MAEIYRTHLADYAEQFGSFLRFRREDGILEARLHTDDGPLRWNLEVHRGLIPAMAAINDDPENECMILTGTGDTFLAEFDRPSWETHGFNGKFGAYQGYDIFYRDQTREPFALLNLQIPVIAAINGPSIVHAELGLLNDIVLASENTHFYEGHWDGLGIVPGDGVHTLFRELLGPNRGRYFLLTGQRLSARQALDLGLVGEVLPQDQLLDRAWELARSVFMSKNRIQRRLTRSLLIQPWRELFVKELPSGMAHESLGCYDYWPMSDEPGYDISTLIKREPSTP